MSATVTQAAESAINTLGNAPSPTDDTPDDPPTTAVVR